jgi:hypothetical protein
MNKKLLALICILFASNASAQFKQKTCYMEDNTRVFKIIQMTKKDNSISFTGYELDLQTKATSSVYGSGYVENNKLFANLTYQVMKAPMFAFFDAYTMEGTGESTTVTIENKVRKGFLVQVPCDMYF